MGNKGTTIHLEWHSLVKDLLINAWIVLLTVCIALMGIYVAGQTVITPTYTCSATFAVRNSAYSSSTVYLGTTSQQRQQQQMTEVLSQVIVQSALKQKAAESLGWNYFPGTLSAGFYENTNILLLSVTASSPEKAFLLLRAVIENDAEFVNVVYANVVLIPLQSPEMPVKATYAITGRTVAIAAAAAFLGSLALIVALSVFRNTVKDEETFHREIDAELLGTVMHEEKHQPLKERIKKKKRSLLLYSGSHSTSLHFNESFQKIAMRLSYLKRTDGYSVFAITSVAENEGKSTVAANIALALASRGHRVLLLDADTRRPALNKFFSLDIPQTSEFNNYLSGNISLEQLHFHRYRRSNLYMGMNNRSHREVPDALRNERLHRLVEKYRSTVDFIIFDTAPLAADSYVTNLCTFVDETMLVVRTDAAYCASVNDAILSIKEVGGRFAGCVLNDVYPEFSLLGQMGLDESGYVASRYRYRGLGGADRYSHYKDRYSKYGKYDKYDKYGKYSSYGKYDKYTAYSKYTKYDKYAKYSAYGYGTDKYDELDNPFENESRQPETENKPQEGAKSEA